MPSIQEVAKQAGVAPSTVSLVANGKPRVSDKTRKHVQSVIEQLKWQPRSASDSQNSGSNNYAGGQFAISTNSKPDRPRHIGVVYGRGMVLSEGLVDYCRKWVMGVRESFSSGGVISVYQGVDHIDNDLMFGHNLEKNDFDGVVLMGVHPEDGYLDTALKLGVKTIVMNQRSKHGEFSSVRADSWSAGRMAAKHFLDLGHSRIASLIPRFKTNDLKPAHDLRGGFLEGLSEKKLKPIFDMDERHPGNMNNLETIKKIAGQFIDSGVTACFTGDPVGLRLAHAMEAIGVDVPNEFSILGWDDLGYKTNAGKKLSSIGYSKNMMGLMAGRMLQNLFDMNGDIACLAATVPVKMNDGNTTAPISKHTGGTGVSPVVAAQQEASSPQIKNPELSPYEQIEKQTYNKQEQQEPERTGV